MDQFPRIRQEVESALEKVEDQQEKASLSESCQQIVANHKEYLAHMVRTKHQGGYYRYVLSNLRPGEIVVIIDYKMKVELGLRTRENQREWYGKRGISLHGFLVIAQVSHDKIHTNTLCSALEYYTMGHPINPLYCRHTCMKSCVYLESTSDKWYISS